MLQLFWGSGADYMQYRPMILPDEKDKNWIAR
jgi:hypothetical protein